MEETSVFGFFKRRRRERLRSAPFPAAWLEIIEKHVPFYACLPDADRRELQGLVRVFVGGSQVARIGADFLPGRGDDVLEVRARARARDVADRPFRH